MVSSHIARSLHCGTALLIAATVSWLCVTDAEAGPVRRMYRRASRPVMYSAAPSYPVRSYAPASGYYGPTMPPANFFAYGAYGAPYGSFGPVGPAAPPPPYYFFSGVVRPGFGPPWGRLFPNAMNAPSEASVALLNPPPADQVERVEQISDEAYISGLYRDILGREPDEPGLTAWVQALHRGMSRRAVANYFLNSRDRVRPRPTPVQAEPVPRGEAPTAAIERNPAKPNLIEVPAISASAPPADPVPESVPPIVETPDEEGAPAVESLPEEVPAPPPVVTPKRGREF